MSGEVIVFWVCAVLAVTGAVGLIVSRKAVHGALWVAFTMINLAVLYLANSAPFLGMVQVIVYTGAIMMLFLFVLMVVGVDSSDSLIETIKAQRIPAILLSLALGIMLVWGIGSALTGVIDVGLTKANNADGGNVQGIARLIFTDYLIAFEVTSALLITAALGAMVLAHRERWMPAKSQAELARERIAGDGYKGSLPAPGTYARHNAVDTPALLPDGSIADISVPRPLSARADVRPVDRADIAEIEEANP